ncbi:hypothetical protein FRB98_009136 [Tulasnella sp. 332]|nr:hypothetical protein FRB98_009136 [Tulasnella sp. 332]
MGNPSGPQANVPPSPLRISHPLPSRLTIQRNEVPPTNLSSRDGRFPSELAAPVAEHNLYVERHAFRARRGDVTDEVESNELTPGPSRAQQPLNMEINHQIQKIVPFIRCLYHVLQDPLTDHIIKWGENGKYFYIYDEVALMALLKSLNGSRSDRFESFKKQLTNHDIHKLNKATSETSSPGMYHHKPGKLLHNRDDLLCEIVLKKKARRNVVAEPPDDYAPPMLYTERTHSPGPVARQAEALPFQEDVIGMMQRQIEFLMGEVVFLRPLVTTLWNELCQRYGVDIRPGGFIINDLAGIQQPAPFEATTEVPITPLTSGGTISPPIPTQSHPNTSYAHQSHPVYADTNRDHSPDSIYWNEAPTDPSSYLPASGSGTHPNQPYVSAGTSSDSLVGM